MKKLFFLMAFTLMSASSCLFANATNIQTATNVNGDVAAVWQTYDGIDFNLAARVLPEGGSWGATESLGTSQMETNPLVAINNNGEVAVIWAAIDYGLGVNVLYLSYYDGVSWSSPVQISANDENVYYNYQISLADTGWIVVTWSSYSYGVSDNIVRSNFGAFGSLSGPNTIG